MSNPTRCTIEPARGRDRQPSSADTRRGYVAESHPPGTPRPDDFHHLQMDEQGETIRSPWEHGGFVPRRDYQE